MDKDPRKRKTMPDFDTLLSESEGLITHIDTKGTPAIQRSIPQLDVAARKLAKVVPRVAEPGTDTEAQMVLAQAGLDIEKQRRKLKTIDLSKNFQPLEPIAELDLEKFLLHQHQMTVATAIEEANKMTANRFRRHYESCIEEDWENTKREILDSMGFRTGAGGIQASFPGARSSAVTAPMGSPSPAPSGQSRGKVNMNPEAARYARVVRELNEKRRAHESYPVVTQLLLAAKETASQQHDSFGGEVVEMWTLLKTIVREDPSVKLNEKAFVQAYAAKDLQLRQQFIEGAKKYLEQGYHNYIKVKISDDRKAAQRPGIPGLLPDVRGFLNVVKDSWPDMRSTQVDKHESFPLWMQVFYCYRCGGFKEAIDLVRSFAQSSMGGHRLQTFINCMEARIAKQEIPMDLWKQLNEEYSREVVGHSALPDVDTFKNLMYRLIGRFKPTQPFSGNKQVSWTVEDWMWFKLSMLWESDAKFPDWIERDVHPLSLRALQDTINSHGEARFNQDGRTPLRYFTMLLITQQFEMAVHFLTHHPVLFVVGLHSAVALDYYGLLRKSTEDLDAVTPSAPSINLLNLLRKYSQSLWRSDHVDAAHYLFLLLPSVSTALPSSQLNQSFSSDVFATPNRHSHEHKDGNVEAQRALDALGELVLESQEFDKLAGILRGNQLVKKGCIFEFLPARDAQYVMLVGANRAEQNGRDSDAVRLYDFAQDDEKVGLILVRRLSALVASPFNNATRTTLVDQARRFLDYRKSLMAALTPEARAKATSRLSTPFKTGDSKDVANEQLSAETFDSLSILSEMINFFDLYHAGIAKHDEALMIVDRLKFFPKPDSTAELETCQARFERLNHHVRRTFGDLATAVMEIYCGKYRKLKAEVSNMPRSGKVEASSRDHVMLQLRAQVRALVTFVGSIQYQLNADVAAKLSRLEAQIS